MDQTAFAKPETRLSIALVLKDLPESPLPSRVASGSQKFAQETNVPPITSATMVTASFSATSIPTVHEASNVSTESA